MIENIKDIMQESEVALVKIYSSILTPSFVVWMLPCDISIIFFYAYIIKRIFR